MQCDTYCERVQWRGSSQMQSVSLLAAAAEVSVEPGLARWGHAERWWMLWAPRSLLAGWTSMKEFFCPWSDVVLSTIETLSKHRLSYWSFAAIEYIPYKNPDSSPTSFLWSFSLRGNLKRISIFTGLDSSQALLCLGRCHESQSVEYLQSLPQTEITFGKYRATNRVDKYEYCRPEDCPGGRSSSTLPADCPEFIAAIQFNRRLQFSRLLLPGRNKIPDGKFR